MYSLTVCNLFYFYFFLLPIPFIHWCRTTIFHLHIGGEGVFCVRAFVCCLCIVFGECCAVGCNRKCISTVNSKHSEQYSFCVPNKTTHIHNVVSRTFFFNSILLSLSDAYSYPFGSFKQLMAYFSFGW